MYKSFIVLVSFKQETWNDCFEIDIRVSLDTLDLFEGSLKDNISHFFFSERFKGTLIQI